MVIPHITDIIGHVNTGIDFLVSSQAQELSPGLLERLRQVQLEYKDYQSRICMLNKDERIDARMHLDRLGAFLKSYFMSRGIDDKLLFKKHSECQSPAKPGEDERLFPRYAQQQESRTLPPPGYQSQNQSAPGEITDLIEYLQSDQWFPAPSKTILSYSSEAPEPKKKGFLPRIIHAPALLVRAFRSLKAGYLNNSAPSRQQHSYSCANLVMPVENRSKIVYDSSGFGS
jgi:hypothetical protein